MNRNSAILLIAVAAAVALGSFSATRRRQQSGCGNQCKWLYGAPQSVLNLEDQFNTDAATLDATLRNEQSRLAGLIENPDTSRENILAQAQTVSNTREQLMRRAGQHVITMRKQLPARRCHNLMQFSAEVVCGSGRGQCNGACGTGNGGAGAGGGRYRWRGRPGNGQGRGAQGCAERCGLACKLELTEAQLAAITVKDPDYDATIEDLRAQMATTRETFAAALQDDTSTNEQLQMQLDSILEIHRELDMCVARHVIALRDELTPEQQKTLIGLCSNR